MGAGGVGVGAGGVGGTLHRSRICPPAALDQDCLRFGRGARMRARSDLDQGMHAGAACRPACVGFAPCPPVAALPEHGRADKSAQRQGGQRAAQPVPHVRGIRRPDKKPCSPSFYTIGGRSRQSRTAATGNGGEKADRQMLSSLSSACRARTLIPPPYWPLSFSTPPPSVHPPRRPLCLASHTAV